MYSGTNYRSVPPVSVTVTMSSSTAKISFPFSALSSRNSAKLRDMIFQSKGLQGDGTYMLTKNGMNAHGVRGLKTERTVCDTLFQVTLSRITWFTTPEFCALRFLFLPLFNVLFPFKECLNLFVVVKISHSELRLNVLSIGWDRML